MTTQPSKELVTFPNPHPERDYEIRIDAPEFTCVCPVTGQPDWASVMVQYRGAAIDDASLLKYLISYRQHGAYHESTIEQIFLDILAACQPERLSVYGRFQRRGGIDINPLRSTHETRAPDYRLLRQ